MESVVLGVELADEASAPLSQLSAQATSSQDEIAKASEDAQKRISKSQQKTSKELLETGESSSRLERMFSRHMPRAVQQVQDFTKRIGDVGGNMTRLVTQSGKVGGAIGRGMRGATQGINDLVFGFRNSNSQATTFAGRMGTIGGALGRTFQEGNKGIRTFARGFQNANFAARDATGLMGSLGGYARRAADAASGIASRVGNVASSAASAGAAIASNIGSALTNGVTQAGKLAAILGGLVIGEGLRGGISRAMNIEDTEARLAGIGFQTNEISGLMDDATDAIWGTSYRLDEAAGVAATFANAGVDAGDDMQRALGLVGDTAFAAGTSFEEMGQIWGRVAAYGRMDTQTLNQLMDRQAISMDALTDHYGTTEEAVRQMVTNGEVSFEDFADIMESRVGGAAQNMAETTRGAVANVQAGLHMIGAEAAGPMLQMFRGAFNSMQEPVFAVASVITPVFEVLTERASDWADSAYEAGEKAAEGINALAEPMETVADLMRDGMPMFEAITEVFDIDMSGGLGGFLSDLGPILSDLSPLLGAAAGVAVALLSQLGRFVPVIGRMLPVFNPLFGLIIGLIAGSEELRSALFDAFSQIGEALTEVGPIIGDALVEIGSALAPLVTTIAEVFADLIVDLVPVITSIVEIIAEVFAALAPVIGDILGVIADLIATLVPVILTIVEAFLPVLEIVGDLAVILVEALAPVIGTVGELLADFGVLLADLVVQAAPMIASVVEMAGELIQNLAPALEPIIELVIMLAGTFAELMPAIMVIVEVVLDLAITLISGLMPVMDVIVEIFVILVEVVVDIVLALVPLIVIIADLAAEILVALLPILPTLAEAFLSILTALLPLLPMLIELAIMILEPLIGIIEWLAPLIAEFLVGAFELLVPAIEWVAEILEIFVGFLADVFSGEMEEAEGLLGWFSDAWDNVSAAAEATWEKLEEVGEWIGDVLTVLWEDYVDPILGWFADRWDELGETAEYVWEEILEPAIVGIGDAFTWLWEEVLEPTFSWMSEKWTETAEAFEWAWDNVLAPMLGLFGATVSYLWEEWIEPALSNISDGWSWMTDRIDEIWTNTLQPIFQAVGDFVKEDVVGMIEEGVDLIGDAWAAVVDFFRDPINGVINFVWNDGIKAAFDAVANVVGYDGDGIPEIPEIPAFAKGGYHDGGWAMVGEKGPELAYFGDDARILTATQTQQAFAGRGADTPTTPVEAKVATGQIAPHEAPIGGILGRLGNAWNYVSQETAVGRAISDGIDWARGKLADGAELVLEPARDWINDSAEGKGHMGDLAAGFGNWGIDSILGWIRGHDEPEPGEAWGGEFTANPGGFNRPSDGPITSWAGPRNLPHGFSSFHHGVDIGSPHGAPVRTAFDGVVRSAGRGPGNLGNTIVVNHGDFETAYAHLSSMSASPGQEVTGGQRIGAVGSSGGPFAPHLHFERHRPSFYNPIDPNPLFRDEGGLLPPGISTVLNATGGPEYIANQHDFDNLMAMAEVVATRGSVDAPTSLPAPAGPGGGGAAVMSKSEVTVAEGAVQIVIQANENGMLSEEAKDQIEEIIEDIFEEHERRDY